MLTPKAKIILFKGKKLKNGKRPIMLQIKIADNKYKRISLEMSAKDSEWNATDARFKNTTKNKSKNRDLIDHIDRANDILNEMYVEMKKERKDFSFDEFKNRFLGKETSNEIPATFLGFLQWYINYLTEKQRIGDASTYKNLHRILVQYGVKETMMLSDVNKVWLEDYEIFMSKRKNKYTGLPIKKVSIRHYMVCIRTMFNKAIYFEVTSHYPFRNSANPKGYSFSHLKSPRISKSITDEELKLFLDFDWQNSTRKQKMAWKIAYFIFIFRGMPISDVANLTIDDISNNEVVFARIKTKKKVPNIPLDNPKRQWILDLFKEDTDGYHLVPILHKDRHITETQKRNRINKIKTWVNTGLKEIAKIQGIKSNLHTYVFRHSFSRKVLEKYGIWHLKEVLGHQNVNTTQAYAESLSTKQLNKTDDVFDW
jgi:integrase/recombinase XerD